MAGSGLATLTASSIIMMHYSHQHKYSPVALPLLFSYDGVLCKTCTSLYCHRFDTKITGTEQHTTDFEQLLSSLNYSKRAVDESAYIDIDIKMLQTAFAPVLGRDSEFIEDWGEMFPSVDVDVNMHQQVLVRNACRGGDSKQGSYLQSFYNEIGRFSSDLRKKT